MAPRGHSTARSCSTLSQPQALLGTRVQAWPSLRTPQVPQPHAPVESPWPSMEIPSRNLVPPCLGSASWRGCLPSEPCAEAALTDGHEGVTHISRHPLLDGVLHVVVGHLDELLEH